MKIDLSLTLSQDYFAITGRKIDWDGTDEDGLEVDLVSVDQSERLQEILTSEVSIHTLRRVTGVCGSLADSMVGIRRDLIIKYEQTYEPYIEYRDFY